MISLVKTCPKCGKAVKEGYNFCGKCGHKFQQESTKKKEVPKSEEKDKEKLEKKEIIKKDENKPSEKFDSFETEKEENPIVNSQLIQYRVNELSKIYFFSGSIILLLAILSFINFIEMMSYGQLILIESFILYLIALNLIIISGILLIISYTSIVKDKKIYLLPFLACITGIIFSIAIFINSYYTNYNLICFSAFLMFLTCLIVAIFSLAWKSELQSYSF